VRVVERRTNNLDNRDAALTSAAWTSGALASVRVGSLRFRAGSRLTDTLHLRYLWVALAALFGAVVVMAVGKAYDSKWTSVPIALSVGVFGIATLLAIAAALLLGSRLGPGVLLVGSGCGFCCAAGCALYTLAQPRSI